MSAEEVHAGGRRGVEGGGEEIHPQDRQESSSSTMEAQDLITFSGRPVDDSQQLPSEQGAAGDVPRRKINHDDFNSDMVLSCEVVGKVISCETDSRYLTNDEWFGNLAEALMFALAVVPVEEWKLSLLELESDERVRTRIVRIIYLLLHGQVAKLEEITSTASIWYILDDAEQHLLFERIAIKKEEPSKNADRDAFKAGIKSILFMRKNEVTRCVIPWIFLKVWQLCQCVGAGTKDEARQALGDTIVDRAYEVQDRTWHSASKLKQRLHLDSKLQRAIEYNIAKVALDEVATPDERERILNEFYEDGAKLPDPETISLFNTTQTREAKERIMAKREDIRKQKNEFAQRGKNWGQLADKEEEVHNIMEAQFAYANFREELGMLVDQGSNDANETFNFLSVFFSKCRLYSMNKIGLDELEEEFMSHVDQLKPDLEGPEDDMVAHLNIFTDRGDSDKRGQVNNDMSTSPKRKKKRNDDGSTSLKRKKKRNDDKSPSKQKKIKKKNRRGDPI